MKTDYPVTKNESYDLEITNIGSNGEGIGRIEGYTLFVEGAIPGDIISAKVIKVKKSFGFARINEILTPSKDRVEPICPVAKYCGGCTLQHMSYEAQMSYKENLIKDSMERIGGIERQLIDAISEPIIVSDTPLYYRNKVQYPVRQENGKLMIGFYAKHSHRIVETPRCFIQDIYNEEIVTVIRDFMLANNIPAYNEESHTGLLRHIVIRKSYAAHVFHVTLVINGKRIPKIDVLKEALLALEHVEAVSLNVNTEKSNVILGEKLITIAGPEYLTDSIKDVTYQISPLSFYQVNPLQTTKLYEKALEYAQLTGNENVFDLYCGIGTISLFLAQKAKHVYGIEVVEAAIKDAINNAELNSIDNVSFYTGRSEEIMPKLYKEEGISADVVVLDPPRRGCEESLLESIVSMAPEKIVYVSCDPGTLARDVKFLVNHGYQLDKMVGVDMFSHSTHVETTILMTRSGSGDKK